MACHARTAKGGMCRYNAVEIPSGATFAYCRRHRTRWQQYEGLSRLKQNPMTPQKAIEPPIQCVVATSSPVSNPMAVMANTDRSGEALHPDAELLHSPLQTPGARANGKRRLTYSDESAVKQPRYVEPTIELERDDEDDEVGCAVENLVHHVQSQRAGLDDRNTENADIIFDAVSQKIAVRARVLKARQATQLEALETNLTACSENVHKSAHQALANLLVGLDQVSVGVKQAEARVKTSHALQPNVDSIITAEKETRLAAVIADRIASAKLDAVAASSA